MSFLSLFVVPGLTLRPQREEKQPEASVRFGVAQLGSPASHRVCRTNLRYTRAARDNKFG